MVLLMSATFPVLKLTHSCVPTEVHEGRLVVLEFTIRQWPRLFPVVVQLLRTRNFLSFEFYRFASPTDDYSWKVEIPPTSALSAHKHAVLKFWSLSTWLRRKNSTNRIWRPLTPSPPSLFLLLNHQTQPITSPALHSSLSNAICSWTSSVQKSQAYETRPGICSEKKKNRKKNSFAVNNLLPFIYYLSVTMGEQGDTSSSDVCAMKSKVVWVLDMNWSGPSEILARWQAESIFI